MPSVIAGCTEVVNGGLQRLACTGRVRYLQRLLLPSAHCDWPADLGLLFLIASQGCAIQAAVPRRAPHLLAPQSRVCSRMAFSFAKSGGIPFGAFFSVVNKHTHTPIRTVVLLAFTSFLFGLPLLKSPAAFAAIVSMANISLLISYAIPIFCRWARLMCASCLFGQEVKSEQC